MSDIIHKCCVCEAEFRPGSLDEHGKCSVCQVEYPTANSKKEMMALRNPQLNLGKKLTEAEVRQIVKEELNTFKAELKIGQKVDNMAKARAAKQDKKDDDKGDE